MASSRLPRVQQININFSTCPWCSQILSLTNSSLSQGQNAKADWVPLKEQGRDRRGDGEGP